MSTIEKFISNWNEEIPNYTLQAADLKNPHSMIKVLMEVFDRFGIDNDQIIKPPPESEQDSHTIYYWDLLPVINITRVINHFSSTYLNNSLSTNIIQILQPTSKSSHPLLLLLFNLMIFNNDWLAKMQPKEENLFSRKKQLTNLDEENLKLLQVLNDYAEEKAMRADTADELERTIKKLEQDVRDGEVVLQKEILQMEAVLEEKKKSDLVVEQKKSQNEAIHAEIERKKALRVYNVDEVRSKSEKAAADLKESHKKLTALSAVMSQKENNLKNLQTVKPQLETGTNLIKEITEFEKQFKDQREMESGDWELDSVNKEVQELQTQLAELEAERQENAARRRENQSRRNQIEMRDQNTLKEDEEQFQKLFDDTTTKVALKEELLKMEDLYEDERKKDLESFFELKDGFHRELDVIEETLFARLGEIANTIEKKCRDSNF